MTEPMQIQESREIRESRESPGSSATASDWRLDPELSPAARALVTRIGGTPLLPLPSPRASVRILGKAEWMNPGGSVKDRTAWGIVRGALERGDLGTGRRLLDASSGNTAIAYAMLGAALGIDVTICLPANASRERRLTLAARRVASGLEEGTVVTILPDGGERYLSEAWWSTDERSVASVPVGETVSADVSADVSAEAGGRSDGASRVPAPRLLVPSPVLAEIREDLEAAYPAEGCGVLVGQADEGERRVERAVPARNRSSGRNDRYEIDPETLRDLMEIEDAGGPRVLGFYHSHPDAEPVPSATDRERSWPWYVYLIMRVDGGKVAHGDVRRGTEEDAEAGQQARVWTFGPDGKPAEGTLEIVDTRGEEPWPK